jgi:hypothetical protein
MRFVLLLTAASLAACSPSGGDGGNDTVVNVDAIDSISDANSAGANVSPVPAPAPGTPGGLANDMTPVSEAPFTADSAQGAADVVQRYYALLEEKKPKEALALWEGEPGADNDVTLADYSEYHAQIGAPGEIDAGAGQRYVTVPVVVYGRLKAGNKPFNRKLTVTLHRVGDVDGATDEQKRWHIRSIG